MADKAIERKFHQVFDDVCAYVDEQKRSTDFTITDLKNMLETEYVNEGNGWIGRGEVQDAAHSATIAAYQQKIAEWEKELNEKAE